MPPSPRHTLGFGLGLRASHLSHIFAHKPPVDWFEVISENYMDTEGRPLRNLQRIRQDYPIVMHGVSLSIGTVDPLNSEYLQKLKRLMERIEPAWVSDHLCWTGIAHQNTHDLLPVPYTEEALTHIVERIQQVQDFLGQPIAMENPSTYLEFKSSQLGEAEFIARMAKASGCHLLLDVNNVYVTCYNHGLDAKAYLDALPLDHVIQIHLSGHSNKGSHIIDTHDDHVIDEVWNLYKYVVHKAGHTPNTMIEWDDKIPEFPVLYAELEKAKEAARHAAQFVLPDLAKAHPLHITNHALPLSDEQGRMQEAITQEASPRAPDAWIREKPGFNAAAQLGVYRHAYHMRLFDVVAEDYPLLQKYLGEANFKNLLHDFITAVPSTHFNVARYAALLPAFQTTHASQDALAGEICAFETALSQLADAPESAALRPEHLAQITPESFMEMRLHPRKALQLFAFAYPVNAYYEALEETTTPPPAEKPSWLAVFRHDDTVWRLELEAEEYSLLQRLFAGATVGEALSTLDDSFEAKVSEWFSRWMQHGLLATTTDNQTTTKGPHYAVA